MFGRDSCQKELIQTLCSYWIFQQKIGLFPLVCSLFFPFISFFFFSRTECSSTQEGLSFIVSTQEEAASGTKMSCPAWDYILNAGDVWCTSSSTLLLFPNLHEREEDGYLSQEWMAASTWSKSGKQVSWRMKHPSENSLSHWPV